MSIWELLPLAEIKLIHRFIRNSKFQKLESMPIHTFLESDNMKGFVNLSENFDEIISAIRLNNNTLFVRNNKDTFIINIFTNSTPTVPSSIIIHCNTRV